MSSPIESSETWLIHVSAKESRIAVELGFAEDLLENNTTSPILQDEVRRLRHIHEEMKRHKLDLLQKHKKMVKEAGGIPRGCMFKDIDEFEKSIQ